MRIAMLKRRYAQPRGGNEGYTNMLGRWVIEQGHQLHVFTDIDAHCGHPRSEIHTVAVPRRPSFLAVACYAARAQRALRAWERQHGPFDLTVGFGKVAGVDVYHADGGVHRKYLAAKRGGWWEARTNPLHWTILALEKRLYAPAARTHYVCNSQMVRREIQECYGVPDGRCSVLYYGVDLKAFRPQLRLQHRAVLRARLKLNDDDALILFVGGNWARKGLDALVRALAVLCARPAGARWALAVVGAGRPAPYLRLAARLGADPRRLHFAGYQDNVAPWYAAADVVALPSRYDAGSHVVAEAMACGLPVVTSDTNGTAELVAPEFGRVVAGARLDAEELAAALAVYADPAARAAAGVAARRHALALCAAEHCVKVLELYRRIAAAKAAAGSPRAGDCATLEA